MSHAEPAASTDRSGGFPAVLRVVGLVATLVTIAALEYGAGKAAGWGNLAVGVPLALDTFVLGVLLARRSMLPDRLFALGLVEFTVVVSAVAGDHQPAADGKQPNVALGAVLATALVFALWRQDETIRRERGYVDEVAAAATRADAAEREARESAARLARTEQDTAAALSTARERVEAAERRAAAAEARAGELDRQRREDRDDRRPAPSRKPAATTATTDDDRRRIIRLVLAGGTDDTTGTVHEANPAAGRRTIAQAIRDVKHTPGANDTLGELVDEVRASLVREGHHIAAVPATAEAS